MFLSCVSICETGMALTFIATSPSVQVFWAALGCELAEAVGYYLLACCLAFRRVSTVTHLTAMVFTLPFYYLLLLVTVLLRRDISRSRVLTGLIYFPYAHYSLSRQLLVHLCCQSVPYTLVVLLCIALFGPNPIPIAALVMSSSSALAYLVTIYRKGRTSWSAIELLPTENTGEDDLETL
jgi:hypothetical protein